MSPQSYVAHYRIVSKLGEGGMGAVYRATDTRLNRDVAIKILRDVLASDPDYLARFIREAKALAALNHPNIAAVYGVEDCAIVMELVEGRDLPTPLPLDEALPIARQIAEALEAAHEKGIIHRDLKPANIKVTAEGKVKVLDFGLAKTPDAAAATSADSPTLTVRATQIGAIMGTAAYMSPEQARGKPVDKRTDIWAFGVVLYEMLAGRALFSGETVTDTLAAVLTRDPDLAALPADTPPRIRRLIERCLRKDPKLRLRDIGDARLTIDEAEPPSPRAAPPPARRTVLPWAVAGLLAALLAATLTTTGIPLRGGKTALAAPLVRLTLSLPPGAAVPLTSTSPIAISEDGMRIAVTLRDPDGTSRIYTRMLSEGALHPVAGTENAAGPFFSPDGKWLGFVDLAATKLKKVPLEGGPAMALCDARSARGASWGDDGNIAVALTTADALVRVPSTGGTPLPFTPLTKDEITQRWPQILPGSRAMIFTSHAANTDYDHARVDLLVLKSGERRTLVKDGFAGRYINSGHLIYVHQNTLFAAPFDPDRLAVTGPAAPVLEGILNGGVAGAVLAVARNGTALYMEKSSVHSSIFQVDETGRRQLLYTGPATSIRPRFSPDGKRIAFSTLANNAGGIGDLWVRDLDRDQPSRLSFLPGFNSWPVWHPNGKIIFFRSAIGGSAATLYWIRADGSGGPQVLSETEKGEPYSVSPDGKHLALMQPGGSGGDDIYTVPIEGEPDRPRLGTPQLFVGTSAGEITPEFSPDGRWIAYSSNESGIFEVYVRPFPGPGGRWQVSSGGGVSPLWSRTGGWLVFQTLSRAVMRVSYTSKADSFSVGKATPWPAIQLLDLGINLGFDVSPDGKHLVAILPGEDNGNRVEPTVLLNFFDEVRRRAK